MSMISSSFLHPGSGDDCSRLDLFTSDPSLEVLFFGRFMCALLSFWISESVFRSESTGHTNYKNVFLSLVGCVEMLIFGGHDVDLHI